MRRGGHFGRDDSRHKVDHERRRQQRCHQIDHRKRQQPGDYQPGDEAPETVRVP